MNHFQSAAVLAAALAAPVAALAGPVVGLDPTGSGTYTTYADLWTNITDTGLVTGFVPGAIVGPGAGAPYLTELRTQARIGTMTNSNIGSLVTPAGLNTSFEMTKVVRFEELVTSQTATTATFGLAPAQSAAMDVDPTRAGVQNFALYIDQITPGSSSVAVPGNGANTVRCYGAGATGGVGNGCGVEPGDADGDGLMILSGHLIFNAASFTATGAVGTGSFDTRFMIDYVDPAYLDIVTGSIFEDKFTGTTNVPSFFTPTSMWDGATVGAVPFLKVDSSQSFAAVPEPATVAIMGLGLAGLALARRRVRPAADALPA